MKKIMILSVVFAVLLLAACPSTVDDGAENGSGNIDPNTPTYTLKDLEDARSEGKCWTAINGNIYDITEYIAQHPGGNIINEDCGMDSTDLFETRPMGSGTAHSANARQTLETYYIGKLVLGK
jgi:nitrate reductase (NAD(P)H)